MPYYVAVKRLFNAGPDSRPSAPDRVDKSFVGLQIGAKQWAAIFISEVACDKLIPCCVECAATLGPDSGAMPRRLRVPTAWAAGEDIAALDILICDAAIVHHVNLAFCLATLQEYATTFNRMHPLSRA